MKKPSTNRDEHLLRETEKIVHALGRMFAPFCEVVLHDLRTPENAIVAIETPISGRKIGDSTTEMGLARIADPDFPDIVQNYANRFPDGRMAKSTSIGIRNSEGKYIAALCLNMDISALAFLQQSLGQLGSIDRDAGVSETLAPRNIEAVRTAVDNYAAKRNVPPTSLDTGSRRELIAMLERDGALELKGGASKLAKYLGISRASLYNDLNAVARQKEAI
jgi:predicted transcriptional regulator YheO